MPGLTMRTNSDAMRHAMLASEMYIITAIDTA